MSLRSCLIELVEGIPENKLLSGEVIERLPHLR